jgi:hippurate hydrolase
MANVDTVNIDVYGIGGHGAMPEKTIDPIVLASKIVLDLQTIISRKISPMDSAVITVGAINGGTKSNLIPDQVKLQLTIRSYEDDVRDKILDAVKKITDGNAMAAGLSKDKYPKISYLDGFVPSLYNSPDLTNKVMSSIVKSVGKENVAEAKASMVGEDFSRYGRTKENIPITMLRLGIGDPKQIAKKQTPVLHSSTVQIFSPKLVIKTGVKTMADTIMDLMKE